MPDGAQNPEALTALGWTRANALVGLFAPANEGGRPRPPLARPANLFASGSQSLRPKQTVAPLAVSLNLSVTTFLKGQEAQLVAAVKAAEGPALVSWQHEAIPAIATLIRGQADDVPPVWPGHRFDLVWVLDLRDDGTWSFAQRRRSSYCRATRQSRSAGVVRPRLPVARPLRGRFARPVQSFSVLLSFQTIDIWGSIAWLLIILRI